MKIYPLMLTALVSLGGTSLAAPTTTSSGALPVVQDKEEVDVIGLPAPEIKTRTWFNHIGQNPSMAAYKGKVIVIEMWATW